MNNSFKIINICGHVDKVYTFVSQHNLLTYPHVDK